MKLKLLKTAAVAAIAAVIGTGASAHATSIGYANSGPGAVAVWLGTYNHGTSTHHLEGSMNLTGVDVTYNQTVAFTLAAGLGGTTWQGYAGYQGVNKPNGLIDGTTNFYAPNGCLSSGGALVSTPNTCGGGVDHWQGAVFSGLTAGTYQFTWTPIANPTAEWSVLNPAMNGQFTISGSVINPGQVPLPAAGWALIAGLGSFAALRRRKKKAA
ncbi:VPLPA-CTERM sorting domain-containing protein [Arenibacterium halophilum]|jgi:hypothetical protein|uniref:VPLPA-CTERM sorting domain-containing protein n=1 Tax=Arenibacterium halophilum TaxID=2583821 RepID=A0ABY2XDX4_9RHOB|nr:VPLPA-CTERM sorting domain-containing protein [Arenibacterium halophilum]TMV14792.1 VPLPA-CTERM sorting domain-containing protein [Arenibacterium halophilum]